MAPIAHQQAAQAGNVVVLRDNLTKGKRLAGSQAGHVEQAAGVSSLVVVQLLAGKRIGKIGAGKLEQESRAGYPLGQ